MGHLEGLDDPVVASLAITAQGTTIGSRLVTSDGLVDNVDHLQVGIALAGSVHPLLDGFQLLGLRETVHPAGILCTPHQAVELHGEIVLLGVVVNAIAVAPVEAAASTTLDGTPFGLVFGRDLVPERVVLLFAIVNLIACCDVAQKLIGVCRQLSICLLRCQEGTGQGKQGEIEIFFHDGWILFLVAKIQ